MESSSINMTEEEEIFYNRSHPTMIQINTVVYVLELIYYSMAMVFVPAYIILSKFARRFHPLLRFQLRLFCIEVIIIILTREIGVIFRLLEGASVHLSPILALIRDGITYINLSMVQQVDCSVFLIALERLLATYKLETYEIIPPNFFAFYAVFVDPGNKDLLSIWNYVTTFTYVLGLMAMETSRILSERQLMTIERELSTSFQCKENIMVVRMFRPIFILFFISRLIQFFSKYYTLTVGFSLGAVAIRIVTHLYNQSVGICFLLVPVMLLKYHNNLTRFTRQSVVIHQANGDVYFQSLMNKWKIDP